MKEATAIDVFCGIGGLTHGFVKEGINVVAGIDTDSTCKYAYEKNNGSTFIEKDIDEITPQEILALYPQGTIKILVGCAPCQPFSKYSNRKKDNNKWRLLRTFAELAKAVQPKIISMENVPELSRHHVFDEFIRFLETEKYHVSWSLIDCVDYGVPQTRTRLVLLASQFGSIKIIPKTHSPSRHRAVASSIQKLEPIKAGETSAKDPFHRASILSEINLKRIAATPPGGGWKDWPKDLILDCHKKESGKTYPSVYGRMLWNEPAPTITTQCNGLGNGRFGHPEQNRAISLREAALLQTFPKYYKFIKPGDPIYIKHIARYIGNAVPVRLGRIIARSIIKHLEKMDE